MKLPVFKAVGASFAYMITHAGEILKALWLPVLLLLAANLYLAPSYIEKIAAMSQVAPGADPAVVFAEMGEMMQSMGLIYLLSALFLPMAAAGVLKPLIRGGKTSLPFYLQFGADELRILFSVVLFIIMAVLAYLVGIAAVVALAFVGAAGGKAVGGIVFGLSTLAMVVAFWWFGLRMSLIAPAAVGARRIGIAESWRVTRGSAWALFFFFFVWAAVLLPLACLFMAVAMPGYFDLIGHMIAAADDPATSKELALRSLEMQRQMFDPSNSRFYVYAAAAYVYTLAAMTILTVPPGVAYRYLAGTSQT